MDSFVCRFVYACGNRYSWWHYSHPPLLERMTAIDVILAKMEKKDGKHSRSEQREGAGAAATQESSSAIKRTNPRSTATSGN